MDIILLAKILAALEWQNLQSHNNNIIDYIFYRYPEILHEAQDNFNHLYLEL